MQVGKIGNSFYTDAYKNYTAALKKTLHTEPIQKIQDLTQDVSNLQEDFKTKNESIDVLMEREGLNGLQDFSTLGKDSSLEGLDARKAVSDMQRDSVLQEYQYFVGSQGMNQTFSEDGTFFQKFAE